MLTSKKKKREDKKKKILNRLPIITQNAKESLNKALDDTAKKLNKKK